MNVPVFIRLARAPPVAASAIDHAPDCQPCTQTIGRTADNRAHDHRELGGSEEPRGRAQLSRNCAVTLELSAPTFTSRW